MFSTIVSYFTGRTWAPPPAPLQSAPAPAPRTPKPTPVSPRSPSPLRRSQPALVDSVVISDPSSGNDPTSAPSPLVTRTRKAEPVVHIPLCADSSQHVKKNLPEGRYPVFDSPRPIKKTPTRRKLPSGTNTDAKDHQVSKPLTTSSYMIVPEKYDLNAYLKGAILPPLGGRHPKNGENAALIEKKEKSGKDLLVLPKEETGGIRCITRIATQLFKQVVDYYHKSAITDSFDLSVHQRIMKGPESRIVEALTLQAFVQEGFLRPEKLMPELSNASTLDQVVEWLIEGPLKTAQRATHLANFSTRQWGFEPLECSETANDEHQRVFVWKYHSEKAEVLIKAIEAAKEHLSLVEQWAINVDPQCAPSDAVSLAVFVQPPWIMGLDDMEDFIKCAKLPPLGSITDTENISASHRLWYSVLNTCKELNVTSFIVTSYEGWVYGKFASGSQTICTAPPSMMEVGAEFDSEFTFERVVRSSWSRCAVSSVYKYNALSPTTMQSLTYWIAQSMQLRFTDVIQSAITSPDLCSVYGTQTKDALPDMFEDALRSEKDNIPKRIFRRVDGGRDPVSPPPPPRAPSKTKFTSAYPKYLDHVWPNYEFRNDNDWNCPSSPPPKKRYAPYTVRSPRSSKSEDSSTQKDA